MSGTNCIISLVATDWTGAVRQPEGSDQPELSAKCCRLPLRGLDEQQSIRRLASAHTVNLHHASAKHAARASWWSRPHTCWCLQTFTVITILLHNTAKKFCKIKYKEYLRRPCIFIHWKIRERNVTSHVAVQCVKLDFGFDSRPVLSFPGQFWTEKPRRRGTLANTYAALYGGPFFDSCREHLLSQTFPFLGNIGILYVQTGRWRFSPFSEHPSTLHIHMHFSPLFTIVWLKVVSPNFTDRRSAFPIRFWVAPGSHLSPDTAILIDFHQFSNPSMRWPGKYLILCHNRLLPHSFQFITHIHSRRFIRWYQLCITQASLKTN
jgi:hypothetical protein